LIAPVADALCGPQPIPEDALLLLVSQDCDVAHNSYEAEPFIEFLVANRKAREDEDKGLQWGKHPRRFQFWIEHQGDGALFEVDINDRYRAGREILLSGLPEGRLDSKLTEVICRWVAKRYTRPAFPDEFNKRCRTAREKMAALFKKHGDGILSIHIRLEPEDVELPEGEDYRMTLYAVCERDTWDNPKLRASGMKLIEQIGIKLAECNGIVVDESVLVPEHRFSLEDARNTDRWDYDYLTYRGTSTEPIVE
jgi:hypothetical protein